MIISLFENNLPMRFGVILYSTKLIQKIESNIDELQLSSMEDDSQLEEDISSLVIASSHSTLFVPFFFSNNNNSCFCSATYHIRKKNGKKRIKIVGRLPYNA